MFKKHLCWKILATTCKMAFAIALTGGSASADDSRAREQAKQIFYEANYLLAASDQNETERFATYQKSAKRGDAKAQHNLGIVYFGGEMIRNHQLSYMWLDIAAENGNSESRRALEQLEILMPAKSISVAKKLAKKCKASNYQNCE